jgi:adenylylsulfate kinase-like enzyme
LFDLPALSGSYEEPEDAKVVTDTMNMTPEEAADMVIAEPRKQGDLG